MATYKYAIILGKTYSKYGDLNRYTGALISINTYSFNITVNMSKSIKLMSTGSDKLYGAVILPDGQLGLDNKKPRLFEARTDKVVKTKSGAEQHQTDVYQVLNEVEQAGDDYQMYIPELDKSGNEKGIDESVIQVVALKFSGYSNRTKNNRIKAIVADSKKGIYTTDLENIMHCINTIITLERELLLKIYCTGIYGLQVFRINKFYIPYDVIQTVYSSHNIEKRIDAYNKQVQLSRGQKIDYLVALNKDWYTTDIAALGFFDVSQGNVSTNKSQVGIYFRKYLDEQISNIVRKLGKNYPVLIANDRKNSIGQLCILGREELTNKEIGRIGIPAVKLSLQIENVKKIGKGALAQQGICRILDQDNLEIIQSRAFEHSALKEIQIGDKVQKIGNHAYSETHIQQVYVVIPESVKFIGGQVFNTCNIVNLVIKSKDINLTDDALNGAKIKNIFIQRCLADCKAIRTSQQNIHIVD